MPTRSLCLAVATAICGVVLSATAANAAVVYRTDPVGDTTGSHSTATTRKNADIKKVAVWKESGRIFVKTWVVDLTSGISGSVLFDGVMSGTTKRVELGVTRGAGPYLLVAGSPRCASSLTRRVDLTANTFVVSAPASCMPAGTWNPRARTTAFRNNYYHAKDVSPIASIRVR